MLFVVHRLQELGRGRKIPLHMLFIKLQKAKDSVDRKLQWEVLERFGLPAKMLALLRQFHDGMRASVLRTTVTTQGGLTSPRGFDRVACYRRCCSQHVLRRCITRHSRSLR